jgi:hypothetical protein
MTDKKGPERDFENIPEGKGREGRKDERCENGFLYLVFLKKRLGGLCVLCG